jgi:uncharacterized protein (TIGR03118 family)
MDRSSFSKGLLLSVLAVGPLAAVWGEGHSSKDASANSAGSAYEVRTLVSDGSVPADVTDPNLVNGWGVAFNPNAVVWVANEGSGKATLYNGAGQVQTLVVTIPAANGEEHGTPTGIVFSSSNDFPVTKGTVSGPSRFIFATTGGLIAGWAPNVDTANALLAIDNSASGAVYTGLATGGNGTVHTLYAADFAHARVDVFDGQFNPIQAAGGFVDKRLPKGYSPFGIQAINGDIYVTYAKQSEDDPAEEVHGAGLGIVNVFDPNGVLIRRVATRGVLNAPWGLALAPASFGRFGGALLVGNLGDGAINAYGPVTGTFLGTLRDSRGKRILIDGLWGIQFGNGLLGQETNALFFAAGPDDEEHGAYGVIRVRNH